MSSDSAEHWPHSKCLPSIALGVIGLLAFFYNLPLSLFGCTEGLYAAVTETMVRSGEYVHLRVYGQPYFSKPPMFFWLQALSTQFFGWHEAALRLPSALFSLGTVVVTYWLGRTLFSPTAGFWAGLVVTTSYASLWFGQMAIIDPILTFFMSLGVLGFVRAYFNEGSPWWFVVGFVALALGAMVKNLHAFAMPVLLFVLLLWVLRDATPVRSPHVWLGLLLVATLLGSYYAFLGQEFWQHFLLKENLQRMTRLAGDTQGTALDAYFGKRPIYWYFYVIWFDFFPWSFLLPTGLYALWKQRPFTEHPREACVLVWIIGYIVALSLLPEKHERYLMPLVPGIALMIGYLYHRIGRAFIQEQHGTTIFNVMLGVLSVAFGIIIFLAPFLLHKKWNIPTDVFPALYQGVMILGAVVLAYSLVTSQKKMTFNVVGMLAIGLMMGLVLFVVPGINAVASPKLILTEVRSHLSNPSDPIQTFQHWNWRNDEDLYYWDHVHHGARIVGEGLDDRAAVDVLKEEVRRAGRLVILMRKIQFQRSISQDTELTATVLREFLRPKKTILLVAIELTRS